MAGEPMSVSTQGLGRGPGGGGGAVLVTLTLSKAAVLTDADSSPAALATRLLEYGDGAWTAWVCERLGGVTRRWRFDRMSTVCHPESGDVTASFAEVAKYYGAGVDVCPSRRGWRTSRTF